MNIVSQPTVGFGFAGPMTGRLSSTDWSSYGQLINRKFDRSGYQELANVGYPFGGSTGGLSRDLVEFEVESWRRLLGIHQKPLREVAATLFEKGIGAASEAEKSQVADSSSLTATAQMRVDRIVDVQADLGFNTQDFAAVLGITRQQLYKWLNASADVRLQESSRARLGVVERIAKEWRRYSNVPLSAVAFEETEGGVSAFKLLVSGTIDEDAVSKALLRLRDIVAQRVPSRSARLASLGVSRRPSVQSLRTDE